MNRFHPPWHPRAQSGHPWIYATEVVAKPAVGSVAEFVFTGGPGGRFVVKMEIAALEPGRRVQWTVKEGVPDWAGTHVTCPCVLTST